MCWQLPDETVHPRSTRSALHSASFCAGFALAPRWAAPGCLEGAGGGGSLAGLYQALVLRRPGSVPSWRAAKKAAASACGGTEPKARGRLPRATVIRPSGASILQTWPVRRGTRWDVRAPRAPKWMTSRFPGLTRIAAAPIFGKASTIACRAAARHCATRTSFRIGCTSRLKSSTPTVRPTVALAFHCSQLR